MRDKEGIRMSSGKDGVTIKWGGKIAGGENWKEDSQGLVLDMVNFEMDIKVSK